jgi:TRAP-type mannitol/chloroaromatic compound transport system substrate-binding protein
MFFNVKTRAHKIIGNYRRSTDKDGATALAFLIANRHDIVKYHGYSTFREMTLNYRVLFDRRKVNRIKKDYRRYILTKADVHQSDLAISYNIAKYVNIDPLFEVQIVEFMYERLQDKIPPQLATYYFTKKQAVMDYVKKNIVTKTPV